MSYAHIRSDGTTQFLLDHLNQVAERAGNNGDKIELKSFGEISGILHDYGKINPVFQNYLKSAGGLLNPGDSDYIDFERMKGKIDHSTAGAQLIYEMKSIPVEIRDIISMIITAHHGGLLDFITPEGLQPLQKRLSKDIGFSGIDEDVNQQILQRMDSINLDDLKDEFRKHVEKLKRMGKDTDIMFMIGMTIKFLFSSLVDADRLDTINFENPNRIIEHNVDWNSVVDAINLKMDSFEVRSEVDQYRMKISDACFKSASRNKGIYRLTVPTGGGKTLASLRFAASHVKKHNMSRIIYVIPYTSIIDQNAETVRRLLKSKGLEHILLEHHTNLSDEEDTDLNHIYSENWDTEIIFTTMVQFLETIFSGGTKGSRRLHNLSNSVIIFDEVQTISIKNIYIFNNALRYLSEICGSTILLCTATQPVLDDDSLSPYNLLMAKPSEISITSKDISGVFDRVEPVDMTSETVWKIKDTADLAITNFEMLQSVLVIVNTKAAAREIAEVFESRDLPYFHLSTNMCPKHRISVLSDIRSELDHLHNGSGKPILCISTQLVEAGVDLDFNTVIRHIAGLDSIVQAAGRCNRNGLMQSKGKLFVVNPIDEKLSRLKDIQEGKRITEKVLRQIGKGTESESMLSNRAIELYFKEYYFSRKNEMSYFVKIKEYDVEDTILNLLSKNSKSESALKRQSSSRGSIFHHAFKTAGKYFKAIDSNTKGIVVPYGEGAEIINRLCSSKSDIEIINLIRKAQRYSVNVFDYQIKQLYQEGAIHETQTNSGILYLDANYYSDRFGLNMSGSDEQLLLI